MADATDAGSPIDTDIFSSDGSDSGNAQQPETRPSVSEERLREVLRVQFDLELLLKRHELAAIRTEIDHANRQLASLRSLLLYGEDAEQTSAAEEDAENAAAFAHIVPASRSAGTHSPLDDSRTDGAPLYVRRFDGTLARVFCPECSKTSFSTVQGFVNHCRIMHDLRFPSNNYAVSKYSVPVDENGVSINDPVRTTSSLLHSSIMPPHVLNSGIASILSTAGAPSKLFGMPEKAAGIKVYETDVDLDEFAVPELVISTSEQEDIEMEPADADSDDKDDMDEDSDDDDAHLAVRSRSAAAAEAIDQQNQPHALSAVSGIASSAVRTSRFHTIHEMIVGNTSRLLDPTTADPSIASNNYRFKWMVYLRDIHASTQPSADDPSHLSRLIRKVRFFLHPDYRPFDVVDVTSPPFQLVRYGWGECPVRLQIHFWDPVNKLINVIHMLRLTAKRPGLDFKSSERVLAIEIDRNTKLRDVDPSSRSVMPQSNQQSHSMDNSDDSTALRQNQSQLFSSTDTDDMAHDDAKTHANLADTDLVPFDAGLPDDDLCHLIELGCKRFPIIRKSDIPELTFPYTTATSFATYMSWPMGKRKATEIQRALALQKSIRKDHGKIVSMAAISTWCRKLGLTPSFVLLEQNREPVVLADNGSADDHDDDADNDVKKQANESMQDGSAKDNHPSAQAVLADADPESQKANASQSGSSKTYCRTCGKLACNMCLPLSQIRFNSTTRLALGVIPDPDDADTNMIISGFSSSAKDAENRHGRHGGSSTAARSASSFAQLGSGSAHTKYVSTSASMPTSFQSDIICDIEKLEKRWLISVVDKLPSCRWHADWHITNSSSGGIQLAPVQNRMAKPLPKALALMHLAVKAFLKDVLRGSVAAYRTSLASHVSRISDDDDAPDEDHDEDEEGDEPQNDKPKSQRSGSDVGVRDGDANMADANQLQSQPTKTNQQDGNADQHAGDHNQENASANKSELLRTRVLVPRRLSVPKALLVPPHVYEAIVANPRLGFLTNQGMLDLADGDSGPGSSSDESAYKRN